ncbi:class I SAM-dependent methyltransferase [Actinoplanes sp. NBRC 101535]|uniref:class I SAM-dependent methyltransferase n=1 Tax=Actinoplanes sp. NBRC 101535 TaxID=3032196 RepID=UPI0024A02156|nr:class I SAM-dependent methyltransferase [Actinoplanes sp. NBRC 101535]GLY07132.1 hypothetical protein Acsp01_75110 [Actinoplanes sp. NBRC 101535]
MPDTYSFDNDDPIAAERHVILGALGDPYTIARLETLGDLTGKRCLEVGAGGGSIAGWLAGRGADVLATDLKPQHLPEDAAYRVLEHDVVTDPVPEGPWDLVHARLLLAHLPERDAVLVRLAAALAPGGVLLIEDWVSAYSDVVLAAPDEESAALVERYQEAIARRLLPGNGADPSWGKRTHAAMLAAGLTGVHTEIQARSWAGGTPGARLIAVNLEQMDFRGVGFTDAEITRLAALSADPRLVVRGHFTYSVLGRRP